MNPPPWPWNTGTPLRFDRFMEMALHDPDRGYYARRIRRIGRGGDFTTTPTLTPALGKAVAAWAVETMKGTGCRTLIELGPGEGLLARDVTGRLPWWTRMRARIRLVETSAVLAGKQRELLKGRVSWDTGVVEALQSCGGNACIYSNEFADAFPVRRFRRETGGWSESFLEPGETWQPCDSLPDSSVFDLPHPVGQIVEVSDSYRQWLQGWLPQWKAGSMLTIDYGNRAEAVYHRRPHGTVRAYFMQQRLEGPAIPGNAGHQDLTADVNFTDLQRWAAPRVETLRLVTQRDFLLPHADAGDPADRHAMHPEGAGGGFLVLEQRAK